MNPLNTLAAAVFAILFTIAFVVFYPKNCSVREGFSAQGEEQINSEILTCPKNTTTFVDNKDNINCCEGSVTGITCNGKVVCSLSTNKSGIPLCNEYMKAVNTKFSKEKCPPSMKNYFTKTSPGGQIQEFCTSSELNNTQTAPADSKAKICTISNYEFDIRNPNSCESQRLYDIAVCPNEPCQKKMVNIQPNKAVIVQINYMDKEGNPRTCYDDVSMRNYYRDINKELQQNNINMCSNSKKVYIDKTMKISDTSI